jgi:hypothetical protein
LIALGKEGVDDVFYEPLVSELEVVTYAREEEEFVLLIEGLKSNPVLSVDDGFVEWNHLLVLSRGVELEPFALLGLHHRVLREHHHHKQIQRLQILLVCSVLHISLVIDVCQKHRLAHVFLFLCFFFFFCNKTALESKDQGTKDRNEKNEH